MHLFERMIYLHEKPKAIAVGFAEYIRQDPDASRADICRELTAILERRALLTLDLELLKRQIAERREPWRDFKDIPPEDGSATDTATDTAAIIAAWQEAEKAAQIEAANTRAEIEAEISALDTLFKKICQALQITGSYLTGGEISALKRAGMPGGLLEAKRPGMPEALAKALDAIKREYQNSISEAERLNAEDAEALYNGLIREGFIKGSLTDFVTFVGKLSTPGRQGRNKPVSWLNSGSLFAFFAWQFTKYTQCDPYGFTIRQKALCEAFGIEEKRRQSTIAKDMADFKNGHRNKCKGSAKIEKIFAALPGNNKPTNNNP